jgi:hypothetical protein
MRRVRKNRFISIILVLILIVSALNLSSCNKNRKYDEVEVVAAAKELLKKAEALNFIYYGSGIRYHDGNESNGNYHRANSDHLVELGFSSINELKALTEKTFSQAYSQRLYSTILSALRDDATLVSSARYYQEVNKETGETYIMVNSNFEPMFKDTIVYDYESMKAEKSVREKVYIKVNATVTNMDGESQNITLTINLVEEEDGWKIDNPTYANYNAVKDQYDELKNKDF